jgi:sugar (pentulose or hexulose) kinase
MLCGLADGLDAVQAQGLDGRTAAASSAGRPRNPAVREVARDIFTVPIDVPEQAEYVAIGAARQAAWTLTGISAGLDRRARRHSASASVAGARSSTGSLRRRRLHSRRRVPPRPITQRPN